jgi:hypothetical protein
MSHNSISSKNTATSYNNTPLLTYNLRNMEGMNNNYFSNENKGTDNNYLQKLASEGFFPKNFNNLISPVLSNRCLNFDMSNTNKAQGCMETKDGDRRMSCGVPLYNYFHSPFDCFIEPNVSMKAKREHLDDLNNRISLEKVKRVLILDFKRT